MASTVYLIRHGETQHNIEDQLSGSTDVPLSETGKRQCHELRKWFQKTSISHVYTSPLTRAKESASIIFPNHTATIRQSLRELDYGLYEGYNRAKYENNNDEIIRMWINTPSLLTFPKGDSVKIHALMSYVGLKELANEHNGKAIACISHRTTIRLIIASILNLDLDYFRRIPCSNCGVSIIRLDKNGDFSLETINTMFKGSNKA